MSKNPGVYTALKSAVKSLRDQSLFSGGRGGGGGGRATMFGRGEGHNFFSLTLGRAIF